MNISLILLLLLLFNITYVETYDLSKSNISNATHKKLHTKEGIYYVYNKSSQNDCYNRSFSEDEKAHDGNWSVQFTYRSKWYFTDEFQDSPLWLLGKPNWQEDRDYPPVRKTARYFRKQVLTSDPYKLPIMYMSIKTMSSISVYINGGIVFTWGVPAYELLHTLPSSFSISSPVEITFIFPRHLIPQNDLVMDIAVIVYRPECMEHIPEYFDAKLEATSDPSIPTLIHKNGDFISSYYDETAPFLFMDKPNLWWILDKPTTSIEIIWKWYYNTKFQIVGYSFKTDQIASIHSWQFLASKDGLDWVLLDEQDHYQVSETGIYITSFANVIPFLYIKLIIIPKNEETILITNLKTYISESLMEVPVVYPLTSYVLYTHRFAVPHVPFYQTVDWYETNCTMDILPHGIQFGRKLGVFYGFTDEESDLLYCSVKGFQNEQLTALTTVSLQSIQCYNNSRLFEFCQSSTDIIDQLIITGNNKTYIYSFTSSPIQICLPLGIYTIKLKQFFHYLHTQPAYLTIYYLYNDHKQLLNTLYIYDPEQFEYTLFTYFPVMPCSLNSNIVLFLGDTVPSQWMTYAFQDDSWLSYHDLQFPLTSPFIIARTHINFTSSPLYNSYEIAIHSYGSIQVYLNEVNIYSYCVETTTQDFVSNVLYSTCDSSHCEVHTITGSLNHFNSGDNLLAVMTTSRNYDNRNCFDIFVQFLPATSKEFPRDHDITLTQTPTNNELLPLCDHDINTSVTKPIAMFSNLVFEFRKHRNEIFNYYCIYPGQDALSYPRDWYLYGVSNHNYIEIDHEEYVYWASKEYKCFIVPFQFITYPQYAFNFTEINTEISNAKQVSIAEIRFYYDDTTDSTLSLTITPNHITSYVYMPFPTYQISSNYYTNYTIKPTLPYGLSIVPSSGQIIGVAYDTKPNKTYTISAITKTGQKVSTTISICIYLCSKSHSTIDIEIHPLAIVKDIQCRLIDEETHTIIDNITSVPSSIVTSIHYCLKIGFYSLELERQPDEAWSIEYVTVGISDATSINQLYPLPSLNKTSLLFYAGYAIEPYLQSWSFSCRPPKSDVWMTGEDITVPWKSGLTSDVSVCLGEKSYYFTEFTITQKDPFIGIEININTAYAYRLYTNGILEKEYCLGDDLIYYHTQERCEKVKKAYHHRHMILFALSSLQLGKNILAVELIRLNTHYDESFSFYATYKMSQASSLINGYSDSSVDDDAIFDNNPFTSFCSPSAAHMSHTWIYDNGDGYFNAYKIVADMNCYAVSPLAWTIYGSLSNSGLSVTISSKKHHFTKPGEEYIVYLPLVFSFSSILLHIDAVPSSTPSSSCNPYTAYALADFTLFTTNVTAGCKRDGAFPPTFENEYSVLPCIPTDLYDGVRKRLCSNGVFGDIISECVPKAPKSIHYRNTNYAIVPNVPIDPIIPTIKGAEVTVFTKDELPSGIVIDSKTGTISGKARKPSYNFKVTVHATNSMGSTSTTIYFYFEDYEHGYDILFNSFITLTVMFILSYTVYFIQRRANKNERDEMPKVTEYDNSTRTKAQKLVYVELQ